MLLSFAPEGVVPLLDANSYLSFFFRMTLAFGLSFELPLGLVLLVLMGVVSAAALRSARRYAWFGIFVAAALLTPTTDPFTMLLLAGAAAGLLRGRGRHRLADRAAAGTQAGGVTAPLSEREVFAKAYDFDLDDFQRDGIDRARARALRAGRRPRPGPARRWSGSSRCTSPSPGAASASTRPRSRRCRTRSTPIWSPRHGASDVGLLTGDRAVNGDAPIVVMTTEVLRNMLYEGSRALVGLHTVVLDEVHYLADRERGGGLGGGDHPALPERRARLPLRDGRQRRAVRRVAR